MKTVQMIKGKLLYFCLFLLSSNCLTAEGMPQFNAKSFNSQLFWLIITFSALYITITYFILPRIRENIRLRKNKIANDLERAENIKAEIENIISQSNIKLEEAKNWLFFINNDFKDRAVLDLNFCKMLLLLYVIDADLKKSNLEIPEITFLLDVLNNSLDVKKESIYNLMITFRALKRMQTDKKSYKGNIHFIFFFK